ncbi:transglycosylase SLT domain-containing protein [Patescibacteria group bacterium]
MATRPDLLELYPALKQAQAKTDDEVWEQLDAGREEIQLASMPEEERIRMQPAKDPELTKRDVLIRGLAGAVAGVLVAKGADEIASKFSDSKKEAAPDGRITSASLEVEIMKKMTKGKKNNYRAIMRRFASAKASAEDSRSRIQYARQKIAASNLPAMVKAILPYLPMQESSYRLCLRSGSDAVGPWQFIPSTARKYKLKGNDFDRRCNFKASTDAAIAYFKDIIKKLKASKHYKTLESRYATQTMSDFLSLITINAFNAGEGHMIRAMKLLAEEKDVRKEVDEAAVKGGGQGLYVYLTKVYNAKSSRGLYKGKYGKKYQKGLELKYANESSSYVYDILAYKWLHEKRKARYKEAQNVKPLQDTPSKPSKIGPLTASVSAAAITVLGYLGIKAGEQGKEYLVDTMLSKREMLGLGIATSAAALGGAAENKFDVVKKVGSIDLSCNGDDKETKKGVEYNASDIKKHVKVIKKVCRCNNVPDATIINPKNYKFTRRLAQTTYKHFNKTSDYKFALIAKYYYKRCLHLIDMQLKGKYPLPRKGGKDTVLKRKKYIENALRIIES